MRPYRRGPTADEIASLLGCVPQQQRHEIIPRRRRFCGSPRRIIDTILAFCGFPRFIFAINLVLNIAILCSVFMKSLALRVVDVATHVLMGNHRGNAVEVRLSQFHGRRPLPHSEYIQSVVAELIAAAQGDRNERRQRQCCSLRGLASVPFVAHLMAASFARIGDEAVSGVPASLFDQFDNICPG